MLTSARLLAVALLLSAGALCAAEPAVSAAKGPLSAEELTRKSGIAGGLVSFPHAAAADAPLLIELAKKPSFVIHAMSADEKIAAQLRAAAIEAGVLDRSLYVEQGDAAKLPFANRLVDLLVVTDLSDADLKPETRTEWMRAVGPGRGTALVGRATAAGAGLSKDALTAFAKPLPNSSVASDASGLWATLHTALPTGSDAWSHRLHGPENSQVSTDTTFQAPFLTQWWGLPRQEGFWGTTVVACNGRMFTIRGSRGAQAQVTMTARSQNNGVLLWQRDLSQKGPKGETIPHGGYVPGRSCTVATDDSLYIVEHHAVMRLDAETGDVRSRIEGPKPDGQIKWMAASQKMLVMLAGAPDGMTPISYQTVSNTPVGRELSVVDLESNKVLWTDSVAGDIDERMIVTYGDQLYYLAQGVGVVGRELKTGKVLWTTPDTDVQTEFKTPELKVIKEFLVSLPVLSALPDVLVFRAKWVKSTMAFSRSTGALLWKKPTEGGSYRGLTACPVGNTWIGGGKPLDLKTGVVSPGINFIASGCGPTTGTPNYLVTCFGKVMDIKTQKVIRNEDIKSPCDVGTIITDGTMITMPSECGCYFELKGYRALTSAGDITPHAAPPWKDRLKAVDTAEPPALELTDADWPSYRHDAQRSGANAATVGTPTKILWQWDAPGNVPYNSPYAFSIGQNVKPDYVSTAAVAGEGLVYFGSPDGVVRCLKSDSGKEVWNYPTHSMLFKPPTLWQGRVLIGGGDGYITCLSAQTGKLLWQFQAAPHDRRIFWYGHLISTWPILTGVVVQDGIGYAVAGYQKENGLHAYAFDPKTGQVQWENDAAGSGGVAGPASGFSSGGSLAVGQGKMWTPAGCFELKTGEPKSLGGQFGSEVGVLDAWVIKGGRRISETEETLFKPMSQSGFAASNADPKLGAVNLSEAGAALPAWDATDVLMPPRAVGGTLTLVPFAPFIKYMTEYPAARAAFDKAPKESKPKLVEWADLKTWVSDNVTPAAIALTKDQAIVASSDGKKHKVSGYLRADGKKAWTIDLPEQPTMNGLSVDRDGHVLVSLCNGTVVSLGK